MNFPRLVSPSLTELFVKEMIRRILSGQMSVGERLPNVRELARMMKVSRAVISNGFTHLGRMGFVEIIPRQGVFVADYRLKGTMEALREFLEYNGGRFDPAMMDSIHEIRDCQEVHIVRLAAERRTERDVADLRAQIKVLESASELETLAEEAFTFSLLLARASGNVLYPMLIYSRKIIYEPVLLAVFRHIPKTGRLERMRRIVDLIEAKKVNEAVEYVYETNALTRKIIQARCEPGQPYMREQPLQFAYPVLEDAP